MYYPKGSHFLSSAILHYEILKHFPINNIVENSFLSNFHKEESILV